MVMGMVQTCPSTCTPHTTCCGMWHCSSIETLYYFVITRKKSSNRVLLVKSMNTIYSKSKYSRNGMRKGGKQRTIPAHSAGVGVMPHQGRCHPWGLGMQLYCGNHTSWKAS